MRNAGLDELQAGIKIGGRNINNFRYTDGTTLKAESEEELKATRHLPAHLPDTRQLSRAKPARSSA